MSLAVIAGLTIGNFFGLILSFITTASQVSFSPVSQSISDNRIIASTNKMAEAQVFFLEYRDGKVQVDRTGNEIEGSAVKYSYEKVYDNGGISELRMFVMIDDPSGKPTGKIFVDCAVSGGFGGRKVRSLEPDAAKVLQTTDCAK